VKHWSAFSPARGGANRAVLPDVRDQFLVGLSSEAAAKITGLNEPNRLYRLGRDRLPRPAQAAPKVTVRMAALIGRVCPAGQVTVPASSLMVTSSRVNPPGTARAQWRELDHRVMADVTAGGAGIAAAVGGSP
jgi:hypothetical protein